MLARLTSAGVRLRAWRPRLELITAALAAWAITAAVVGAIPNDGHSHPWARLVVWITGLVGAVCFVWGIVALSPVVELEAPWNAEYDALRHSSQRLLEAADVAWNYFSGATTSDAPWLNSWREYVDRVPIPLVERGPLYRWHETLASHHSVHVRQFYQFAQYFEQVRSHAETRRDIVRTYDRFWRARASVSWFATWMRDEDVRAGAEPLAVLLAYMEVARADMEKIGTTATHIGFWKLAAEWHHNNVLSFPSTPDDR